MTKFCDYCGINEVSINDSSTNNGLKVNYSFCQDCYKKILLTNRPIHDIMNEKLSMIGKVCNTCGCTIDDFNKTMLFSCPDCYKYMREAAFKATISIQGTTIHKGKRI